MSDAWDVDTIAAISTPPGRGGIGIVRFAGPAAFDIAGKLLALTRPLEHMRARFVRVLDPERDDAAGQATLDEAVVTAFVGPQSYTGDDLVEIAAHGSPVVLDTILSAALRHGARLAEPGEFTQRAFLSGRLDLTQAEAVHDLIAAQTLEQVRAAAQQMGGALSRRLKPTKEALLQLMTLLEAGMDFASGELDDVDVVPPSRIAEALAMMQRQLSELAATFHGGSLLRTGVSLALVGKPNAGKSSLFNRLLERPRAIVTPVAGTTRDTIEESWSLQGIPVRVVDTAGLRLEDDPAVDEAERQGIVRSREALADADVVLVVHDATTTVSQEEMALLRELAGRPYVRVQNKVDLLAEQPGGDGERQDLMAASEREAPEVSVSALTGQGVPELRAALLALLHGRGQVVQAGALTNRRQQTSVLEALRLLGSAEQANTSALPHEILLLDLRTALQALDAVTGTTEADEILNRIFSTFCIGK